METCMRRYRAGDGHCLSFDKFPFSAARSVLATLNGSQRFRLEFTRHYGDSGVIFLALGLGIGPSSAWELRTVP